MLDPVLLGIPCVRLIERITSQVGLTHADHETAAETADVSAASVVSVTRVSPHQATSGSASVCPPVAGAFGILLISHTTARLPGLTGNRCCCCPRLRATYPWRQPPRQRRLIFQESQRKMETPYTNPEHITTVPKGINEELLNFQLITIRTILIITILIIEFHSI